MDRKYQPSLLWAYVTRWIESQPDPSPAQVHDSHRYTLYVYRTDQAGAYMMYGPKLYWADEPQTGDHFCNVGQDGLAEHAEQLGEVVVYDRRTRRTLMLGATYAEAWEKLAKTT